MADYYSQAIFQPSIPKHLLTDEDRRFIEAFSITLEPDGEDKFYLYADEWCCNGYLDSEEPDGEEIELTEDDLLNRFQKIIRRSNGELPWISKESAYTCSKMRPDGFGGGAIFITADDIQYSFTGQWLEERISETETGNIGPGTDDSPPAKPIVGVILEGGLVQSVISNAPERISDLDLIILDYDVEGFEEECLLNVPQSSGEIAHAVGHIEKITESGIDLEMVLNQMNARGW
ncbi:hypothetical protein GSUET_05200 [Geobacter sulfurreducens subsp. ethanolicus]|uniref:Methyltransferase FkbM domain-containing protein n=1 Tax=Geomobilimonas luticola TaxID=1114878 RepID=A0ABS5SB58_9BACT|nr:MULTISPECIES: hypothetical protein [Geobacteraceae]MBT0652586.1 hypothetical protein [Geomobilimonas luticola]BEH08908.1 hypothetical protein GSUET_05200 [Geobacter sulfurreducens subsp. ethanolicus]